MATYVILSRLAPDAMKDPSEFPKLAEKVKQKIQSDCPNVKWKDSYALMGDYDVLDIVDAPGPSEVEKAAMIIRCYGRATTQTLHATPWREFLGRM